MGTKVILELVRDDPQQLISHVPHSQACGMKLVDVKPNEAWIRMPWSEDFVGNPDTGVVHGGVITTLVDQAAGSAVMAAIEEPTSIATLDLRIDYMKPATPRRDIVAWAHCFKVTRSIAFVRCVAYHDVPDDPIASAVGSFMLGANRALPAVMTPAGAPPDRGESA